MQITEALITRHAHTQKTHGLNKKDGIAKVTEHPRVVEDSLITNELERLRIN